MSELERFVAETRAQWRGWLAKHHGTVPGVWLVTYKKGSGKPYLAYAACVEEALCFGWVDSRPNKLDEERFMRLFSPRKAGSPWSKLNKARVAALIEQGRMTKAGLVIIEQAKHDGSWTAYDRIEQLAMPADLRKSLAHDAAAKKHFDAFPPSSKKNIYWWIASAKQSETRSKRVQQTVELARDNRKANHYRQ